MEIDHVFLFVPPDGSAVSPLAHLGFVETYRRTHPGQGTANMCYCFDNLYLELLWVDDRDAVGSAPIARTHLLERSLWRDNGACPFGLAWHGDNPAFGEPTWPYRPPYLPAGTSIPVATDSDDPRQPMMFCSPGTVGPAEWPAERRGTLQRSGGFGAVTGLQLHMPANVPASPALHWLADHTLLDLDTSVNRDYAMTIAIEKTEGGVSTLHLPSMELR
ncbi:MAG: VOC family protein [Alphaproteobacteria bacterium]|nr:VOC family protein [Alphaproteobacteria bacterium]